MEALVKMHRTSQTVVWTILAGALAIGIMAVLLLLR